MAKPEPITHKIELQVPDVGLSKAQVEKLSEKFKADLVETMGGEKAIAARAIPIIIVVVPVVVTIKKEH